MEILKFKRLKKISCAEDQKKKNEIFRTHNL